MSRRVTITDVARQAGVSVATVSKVMNGRDGVASETSTHVMDVVERLGYETSLVARSLRAQRTHVIGVLVAELEPFSTEILHGAGSALADTDYDVLAYAGARRSGGVGWERRHVSRLSGTLIDGAVIVTPTVVDIRTGVPVVAVDPHAGPGALPTVESDNLTGALLATQHLIDLGHRRIGFLAGRADLASARSREEGYRRALEQAGIAPDPTLVLASDYRRESARGPAQQLLTRAGRPTAVFAANDQSALGVLDVAAELGLRVPQDLSVVGFDDIPHAARTTPPLTTVRQPIQAMGAAAVSLLLDLIEGRAPVRDHVRLPTTLVVRASTAPPPP